MKLLNAFSLNMLDLTGVQQATFTSLTTEQAADLLGRFFESCIGHADTAAVVGSVLNRVVSMDRVTVQLADGERAIVAQYSGPRLPEGSTTLPEGAEIRFILISMGAGAPALHQEEIYDDQGMPWLVWTMEG